jgi:serine/threonine-protein kinase RsbW
MRSWPPTEHHGARPGPGGHVLLLERSFDLASVTAVRQAVRELIIAESVDVMRAETFTFAINEGLINAVMHGGGRGDVRLERAGDRLVAVVEDQIRTEPFSFPKNRPEPAAVGGRGLWLIARSCDAVRLEAGEQGLRLIMELEIGAA